VRQEEVHNRGNRAKDHLRATNQPTNQPTNKQTHIRFEMISHHHLFMNLGLALAGVLALPLLLVLIGMIPILALLSIPSVWMLLRLSSSSNKHKKCRRRVVVTGGSSGIGLAIACHAATQSDVDEIIILARNAERLANAETEIRKCVHKNNKNNIVIQALSVDVTQSEQIEDMAERILFTSSSKEKDHSTTIPSESMTTHVFCCAGEAHPSKFLEQSSQEYAHMIQLNQLGSIYTSNAFLRRFLTSNTNATVTLCSSMAGQVGIYGFAAYTPTKFALRGYAECVHMELLHQKKKNNHHNSVHIQMAFPPDVDTPGFARENKTKPIETHLISATAGLAHPSDIGARMYREATRTNPKVHVYFNFDGFLLCCLTAGFSPVTTLFDAMAQIAMASFGRFIALFYLADWNRILFNYSYDQEQPQPQIHETTAGTKTIKDGTKPPHRAITDCSQTISKQD
jgi:3-dehydrosphinganine reductase